MAGEAPAERPDQWDGKERREGGNHREKLNPEQAAVEIATGRYKWKKPSDGTFDNAQFSGGNAVQQAVKALFASLELKAEEAIETDPRLQAYFQQYQALAPELKSRCAWNDIRTGLLADNGAQLKRAHGLTQGILFGVDQNGKALFADSLEDPRDLPHCGLDYPNTRKAVMLKREGDKKVPTGYEMFPNVGDTYDKSEEVLMFEETTGAPFVRSKNGSEYVESWLESGKTPSLPRRVRFGPGFGGAFVVRDVPERGDPYRGARRLLRV